MIELQIRPTVWRDYLSLTKPRTVLLHLVTAAAAMFLAAKGLPPAPILLITLMGGGLMAGAANVLNCYFDCDIDRQMERTSRRPLPANRVTSQQAFIMGAILAFAGVFMFTRFISWVAAMLALGALAYYILVYTLWLKRRTWWSSLVGSGAGAFPPLIGWIAVTGQFAVIPFFLFAIIVFWTPPHFWSLAIFRRYDYGRAGLEVAPVKNVALWMTGSAFALVAVSISLAAVANLSPLYLSVAVVLGIFMIIQSIRLQFRDDSQTARFLFGYSIFYLVVLCGVMLVDRLITF